MRISVNDHTCYKHKFSSEVQSELKYISFVATEQRKYENFRFASLNN